MPSVPPPVQRLSQEIDTILAALTEGSISLREIIAVIQGRAYTLLLILLSLPFCIPLPLPGLSIGLGAIITLIGVRLSMRMQPWLPQRLLDRRVSSSLVTRLLQGSRRVAGVIEVLLKPRWSFLVDWVILHHIYGTMIFICGLLLLLPLPIPLSNLLPALTVIFLAAALMERDGYFIVAGIFMFALAVGFFGGIFFGGAVVVEWIQTWFGSVFAPAEYPPPEFPVLDMVPREEP